MFRTAGGLKAGSVIRRAGEEVVSGFESTIKDLVSSISPPSAASSCTLSGLASPVSYLFILHSGLGPRVGQRDWNALRIVAVRGLFSSKPSLVSE